MGPKHGRSPWKRALLAERPTLVSEVYVAIAQERLSKQEEYANGLHELMTDEHFAQEHSEIRDTTPSDFSRVPPLSGSGQMLDAASRDPAVYQGSRLAQRVISRPTSVGTDQYDQWLIV